MGVARLVRKLPVFDEAVLKLRLECPATIEWE